MRPAWRKGKGSEGPRTGWIRRICCRPAGPGRMGGAAQRRGLCRPGCSEQPPGLQLGTHRGHARPDGAPGTTAGQPQGMGRPLEPVLLWAHSKGTRLLDPHPSHAPRHAPPPRCHTGPTTLTGPRRDALGFDQEAPSARGEVAWQAGKGPLLKSATRSGRRTQSPSEAPSHPGTAHQETPLPASPWAGR